MCKHTHVEQISTVLQAWVTNPQGGILSAATPSATTVPVLHSAQAENGFIASPAEQPGGVRGQTLGLVPTVSKSAYKTTRELLVTSLLASLASMSLVSALHGNTLNCTLATRRCQEPSSDRCY